jgi:hypothetical protein
MLESGRAHCIRTIDEQVGSSWDLYLKFKIHSEAGLHRALWYTPYHDRPALLRPQVAMPQLDGLMAQSAHVGSDRRSWRRFLDECDRVVLDEVGETGLAEYLKETRVSVRQFLGAQRRSFLGLRF